MKINYSVAQQYVSRVLLISLCLQSCGGGFNNNPLIPTREKQPAYITTHTQEIIGQTNIQPLVDQTLIAEGGNAVTFYEEINGEIKASVEVVDEKDKVFNGVPVEVKNTTDLRGLPHLPKKLQAGRIHIQKTSTDKPARVLIHKGGGLAGGGKSEDEDAEKESTYEGKFGNIEQGENKDKKKEGKKSKRQSVNRKRRRSNRALNNSGSGIGEEEEIEKKEKGPGTRVKRQENNPASSKSNTEVDQVIYFGEREGTLQACIDLSTHELRKVYFFPVCLDINISEEQRADIRKQLLNKSITVRLSKDGSYIPRYVYIDIEEKKAIVRMMNLESDEEEYTFEKTEGANLDKDRRIEVFEEKNDSKGPSPDVLFDIGTMYYNGSPDTEINYSRAQEWYKKAADQGSVKAEVMLGTMCYFGEGVEKDEIKAVEYYRRAADEGNAFAQLLLARCYFEAIGLDKDYIKSINYFQKAAEQKKEYSLNEFLVDLVVYIARKCLKSNSEKEEAEQDFQTLKSALYQKTIDLDVRNVQIILKALFSFCKENFGQAGIGIIRTFIKDLKSFLPRTRDYHNASEGESESEDNNIVYRAITSEETPSLGIFSKGDNSNFRVIDHVSPNRGKKDRNSQSPWISSTRSIKVAAAWASESFPHTIVKIKLDPTWQQEGEHDHQESKNKGSYDFTNPEDRALFFNNNTSECNATLSSQEVVIYREVPKENITALYTAHLLTDEDYEVLKKLSKEKLAKVGIHSVVKTRKKTKDNPAPRIILEKLVDKSDEESTCSSSEEEEVLSEDKDL